MFTFTYVRRELRRRAGRTVLTALGLALGVGLVAAITAVSSGLDRAQADVLDPLASVGTDLVVTRTVDPTQQGDGEDQPQRGGFLGGGGPGLAAGFGDTQALLAENASVITDLSELGEPGDAFEHDYFLPATQLTFPSEQADEIAALDDVDQVALGLTLLAVHQEGTVPEIVAEFQTGGETFEVDREIEPLTDEEAAAVEECRREAFESGEGPAGPPGPGGGGRFTECLPERFRNFRATFTTPQRVIQQVLNPPQTDITSTTYTIAGVDYTTPDLALITPAQITEGEYLSADDEAVVAKAYAEREGIALGDAIDLNGTTFTVVGLAKPPLGGQTADVYLALEPLQSLSDREDRANVMLVRASDAGSVASANASIEQSFDGATVASAEDVAARVSGSLVDASNLADRLGLILSIVLLIAAFLIAVLLTLSSIAKRVREFGTLRAVGWSKRMVVRQVVVESLAQGALGGVIGIGLGIIAALAIAGLTPPLEATAAASGGGGLFGLGTVTQGSGAERITLSAPIDLGVVVLALGLALLGGLVAGTAGAMRVARLRPSDAMRVVG